VQVRACKYLCGNYNKTISACQTYLHFLSGQNVLFCRLLTFSVVAFFSTCIFSTPVEDVSTSAAACRDSAASYRESNNMRIVQKCAVDGLRCYSHNRRSSLDCFQHYRHCGAGSYVFRRMGILEWHYGELVSVYCANGR